MDQSADGGGAFHGVGQPNVKRKLGRFAGGAHEEEQRSDSEGAKDAPGFVRPILFADLIEELRKVQRLEGLEEQEHAQHEAEVADAVDDESFFARVRGGLFQKVKADEQVAGQADAFPSDKQQNVIGGKHQNQHEEHEQIQVAEEAVVAAFVRHVAGGVDVNEEADPRHDQDHDHGELVHLEIEARAEISRDDPIEVF